ncbi:hypothetical protein J2T09_004391 [Neorhizobium huautlense]|uniref:Uncharacterized protein n=1 Tax=Neorhizobium huautlense TaxID=67774 RepID=A0ABT9PZG2_9HYPH|nr:hypothetical protein [Neorhizobium huautlense]MDP9839615.1 hypothetical protein [Neorhizobium huautlense]
MAKRHPADDELAGALAVIADIDAAVARWMPENAGQTVSLPADDATETPPQEAAEPVAHVEPDVAVVVASIEAADGAKSPLVRFARRLDGDIHTIIAEASGTAAPSTREKILRRVGLSRPARDLRYRDGILASRLVPHLDRAARLIGALRTHRADMTSRLVVIEADLVRRIEENKSLEGEPDAMTDAAKKLENRQDVVEAIIRHVAVCNSVYHKLSIEAERGIIVLQALGGGRDLPLADHFSQETCEVLSSLLDLSGRDMLSMREVQRRKQPVDDSFQHRFYPASRRHDEDEPMTVHDPSPQKASA